jgi:hypothetical protein
VHLALASLDALYRQRGLGLVLSPVASDGERQARGNTADGHALTGEVTLNEPLGNRSVIDGSCDERRPSLAERRRAD